jgi:hypothetical protein
LNSAKLQDHVDVLVIWIGQVSAKNGTATDELNEQAKVFGQQMSVTNFVYKSWHFAQKMRLY